jgi:capsular polysaccharide export protein
VRAFTQHQDIRFIQRLERPDPGSSLLLWGSTPVPDDLPRDVRVYRLEDGFIRSVGLGADLTRPFSWVIDDIGIYYDTTRPSRLEDILNNETWDPRILLRARQVRERLVRSGLTKYNLPATQWRPAVQNRPVVLVAGQVETDASIALGAVDIRTNLALLKKVREIRPGAWLVYKPHPDVIAGLRGAGRYEEQSKLWCDEMLLEGSMHQILEHVDEVHVITSLTGFEALLRQRQVHCHGQPFYAGWGLTHDSHPHPRRQRRLTLDELVAGTLLHYPTYLNDETGLTCELEDVLAALERLQASAWRHDAWWRRLVRPFLARP